MKIDFKKTIPTYSARQGRFDVVEVPPLQYIAIDGSGDPNTAPEYREALQALFPVAYAIKFASKNELGRDYVVMPLEALWWAPNMNSFTTARDKAQWKWTAMILIPDWIDDEKVSAAQDSVERTGNPVGLRRIRTMTLDEGRCVQTLHVGPYDDEAAILATMHDDVIPRTGASMTGKHHEIYLSDARRVEPSRLRTILRQPISP
ncbi:hypothetical protein CH289_03590 [Rhodococcus sp. RS1C4]|uniref:GyrI-like domain-containing protein n=1 Tax=Nocardiaceae TaxID=85025 RepID=UPI0003809188|nr:MULTISPECIES: GyrI-like domain-containing protein [Rhodococcus]OZC53729.1 hypothetical protein CH267_16145 [Rhodococcus sp. 06-621-2]OZC56994.1 hypothetical protein CH289_03590 [Rhodococcus sp. RS1C4]OZD12496.1 hypothetical protein CH248_28165 [Rhodococcus sp. 06-156-4a]OZD18095.1 hypothetical protein CH253_19475 [Rhodococcus sp. 06-156-3C]OZD20342.1 hypothetical protein CH280_04110 [Rhodococcus sp. 06-156-4C]